MRTTRAPPGPAGFFAGAEASAATGVEAASPVAGVAGVAGAVSFADSGVISVFAGSAFSSTGG